MKLPNAHLAIVDQETIVDYLLNPAHPDNGGKSKILSWTRLYRGPMGSLAGAPADTGPIFPGNGARGVATRLYCDRPD